MLPIKIVTRCFSTSRRLTSRKIQEVVEGNQTTISLCEAPESFERFDPKKVQFQRMSTKPFISSGKCSCPLCSSRVYVELAYSDVLVLEQFMRVDGTVLPKEMTGLCQKQHEHVEKCVMQAHWSGLFPDRTIPEFDRTGYKRFNRHWYSPDDIEEEDLKVDHGQWFYIKRYNSRKAAIFDRVKSLNKK